MSDPTAEARLDPRFAPTIDLIRRTGAAAFQLRWSDDEQPTIWFAVVEWRVDPRSRKPVAEGEAPRTEQGFQVGSGLDPLTAVFNLAERVMEASWCVHCRRPASFAPTIEPQPLADVVCFYQWDPEMETFRRSCEGDVKAPGRNDPCYCGSGVKFKRCHGA